MLIEVSLQVWQGAGKARFFGSSHWLQAGALSAAHSASTPQAQPAEAGPSSAESPTAEFVVVDKHDAVEAMAFYIAQTLVQNPVGARAPPPAVHSEAIQQA